MEHRRNYPINGERNIINSTKETDKEGQMGRRKIVSKPNQDTSEENDKQHYRVRRIDLKL
jgi:hypothetical protein